MVPTGAQDPTGKTGNDEASGLGMTADLFGGVTAPGLPLQALWPRVLPTALTAIAVPAFLGR